MIYLILSVSIIFSNKCYNLFYPESLNDFEIKKKYSRSKLDNEKQAAGIYSYNFNAEGLPSGTYVYRLTTEGFSEMKMMLLIK